MGGRMRNEEGLMMDASSLMLGFGMNSEQSGVLDESAILDQAEAPYHRGRAPRPTCVHAERNAACGDCVRLELVSGQWSVVASSAATDD